MIVLDYHKGYLASTPLSDRPVNARRGVLPSSANRALDRLTLEHARLAQRMMLTRSKKALPAPVPFEQVWLSNGKHEVCFTFEELKEVWEFASRKEEARLRKEYNESLEVSEGIKK